MSQVMAIISLHNLNNEHNGVVDDKVIALAQLAQKFNVPDGFVITSEVFDYLFEHTGLRHKIKNLTSVINPEDSEKLQNIANEIQRLVVKTPLPEDIKEAVTEAYSSLAINQDAPLNDLMNSSEELVELDSAPVNYLDEGVSMYNVSNTQRFIEALLSCYGLHYASRCLSKRLKHGLEDKGVSVAVKKTLNPEISGKAKLDENRIIIEAVFGYYADEIKEVADRYVLDCENLSVIETEQRNQDSIARVVNGGISIEDVPEELISKKKIEPIEEFASLIKSVFSELEDFNEFEFTLHEKKLYITSVNYSEAAEQLDESRQEYYDDTEVSYEDSEEKSIFSVFKDQSEEENPYYNNEQRSEHTLDSARHALGHAVIECLLVIRRKLGEDYREIFREEPPSALGGMLEAISDYKTVPYADDLRKISELSRRFTREGKTPNVLEVKYALEKTQGFLDEFS